ncbi:MAG TPA: hypothetical protein VGA03_13720 [Anaerolineales bacterium]
MSTRVDAPIPGSISPTRSILARRPLLAYFLLARQQVPITAGMLVP